MGRGSPVSPASIGHHLGRLTVSGFARFYQDANYNINDKSQVPAVFRLPLPAGSESSTDVPGTVQGGDDRHFGKTNWSAAPRAAFPSYSFSIERSAGLNIGLPVSGVPIAFGLLGSDRAMATVSLKDAYTYGVDEFSMWKDFVAWAKEPENAARIATYSPVYERERVSGQYRIRYNYLRVVTRVYMVGKVNVSVVDSSENAADVKAGVAQNINLISASGDPRKDLETIRTVLNNGLASVPVEPRKRKTKPEKEGQTTGHTPHETTTTPTLPATRDVTVGAATRPSPGNTVPDAPTDAGAEATLDTPTFGARLKFTQVTNRSVALDETFDRPLVIGYLAYDIPIAYGGEIGDKAVATTQRLGKRGRIKSLNDVRNWLREYPGAYQELDEWVNLSQNQKWLKRNKLPVQTDAIIYGISDWKFPIHIGSGPDRWSQLNHRISGEIIERPQGVPLPPPDALPMRTP